MIKKSSLKSRKKERKNRANVLLPATTAVPESPRKNMTVMIVARNTCFYSEFNSHSILTTFRERGSEPMGEIRKPRERISIAAGLKYDSFRVSSSQLLSSHDARQLPPENCSPYFFHSYSKRFSARLSASREMARLENEIVYEPPSVTGMDKTREPAGSPGMSVGTTKSDFCPRNERRNGRSLMRVERCPA